MTSPTGATAAGYTVLTSELRTHAGVLGQVAGVLGQALGAAQQVTLGEKAYGQLPVSAAFAALVNLVASPGVTTITQAASTMNSMVTQVNTVAANYDTTEHNNTGKFRAGAS